MTRKTAILFLLVYLAILFGHGMVSLGHSVLHYTADIVALHNHGHAHDVGDHREVFRTQTQAEESKSAHINMLSLVFFLEETSTISLNVNTSGTLRVQAENSHYTTRVFGPPTPPPIG